MRIILAAILLVLVTFSVYGQDPETSIAVKKSTDRVKIEGNYYYIHIVRKGETLYSISRAYNVSQMEVAMENPDIYLGVQMDQALKIPITQGDLETPNDKDKYIYHVVRKDETLFGLAKKYSLSIQDIIQVNPDSEEDIKLNQVLLIPKHSVVSKDIDKSSQEESERFIYHKVKPREGFFAISKKYGVSQETIRLFNEEAAKEGIKLGTIIRVPKNANDTIPPTQVEDKQTAQIISGEITQVHTPVVVCDTFVYNRWRDVFNVVLLLPIKQEVDREAYATADADVDSEGYPIKSTASVTDYLHHGANFLDFYQGALIALDSLKDMGLSVNISVFNTGKNPELTKSLVHKKELQQANLIIGPVYPECIKPIADFAKENRIPIVSPLSPNNYLLDNNPFLFQVNPSFITQLEEFTNKIDFCSNQNIVLLHEADSTNINIVNSFKEMIIQRFSLCPNANSIHFKEVTYHPGSSLTNIQERISHSLVHDKENLILVPSNNEALVSDLMGNLHTLSTIFKYPISIYGFPRWQRFRNVQVDYYYQLQLHLFTPFYVSYQQKLVKSFITKYRDEFRSEPSQFAFHGYDVFFYFLSAMKSFGKDFQYCLPNHKVNLLQSDYRFKQLSPLGGFENQSVYMIRYSKDYEIVKIENTSPERDWVKAVEYYNEPGSNRPGALKMD